MPISFEPGTNFRAWLVTILRNTYFSQYRKRSREVQDSDNVLAEQIPVKGGQESNVTMQDVQKALNKLAPEHREILLMIGITELSYEEAAQVCNVAIGTVKSRLNRARAKLAEHLGAHQRERHRQRSDGLGYRTRRPKQCQGALNRRSHKLPPGKLRQLRYLTCNAWHMTKSEKWLTGPKMTRKAAPGCVRQLSRAEWTRSLSAVGRDCGGFA